MISTKKCEKVKNDENHDHIVTIKNKWYQCEFNKKKGGITSLKFLKKNNFSKEVVQKDKLLNSLILHDDVPFFWDNWDIMHHTFETEVRNINDHCISAEIIK